MQVEVLRRWVHIHICILGARLGWRDMHWKASECYVVVEAMGSLKYPRGRVKTDQRPGPMTEP